MLLAVGGLRTRGRLLAADKVCAARAGRTMGEALTLLVKGISSNSGLGFKPHPTGAGRGEALRHIVPSLRFTGVWP